MDNQTEIDDFSCALCTQLFNDNQRLPRIFTCGHTFCSSCIQLLVEGAANQQEGHLACPIDNEEIPQQKVEQFPKNIQLLKVIGKMKQSVYLPIQKDVSAKEGVTRDSCSTNNQQFITNSNPSDYQNAQQSEVQIQQTVVPQQTNDAKGANETNQQQLETVQQYEQNTQGNNNNMVEQCLEEEKDQLILQKGYSQDEQLLLDSDDQIQTINNERESQKMCLLHDRQLEVVCITCKVRICTNCALFGNHRSHEIRSEDEVLYSITMRAEQAVDIMQKMDQEKTDLQGDKINQFILNKFEAKKNEVRSIIQSKFAELQFMVKQKEKKALDELEKGIWKRLEKTKSQTRFPGELDSSTKLWQQETQHCIADLTDKSEKGQLSFSFLEDSKNMEQDILQRGLCILQQIDLYKKSLQASIDEHTKSINADFTDGFKADLENYCQLSFEPKPILAPLATCSSSHFFKTNNQLLQQQLPPTLMNTQSQQSFQQQRQFQSIQPMTIQQQQQQQPVQSLLSLVEQKNCSISSQILYQQTQQHQIQPIGLQQYDTQLPSPIAEKEDGNLMTNISESDLQDTSFFEINNQKRVQLNFSNSMTSQPISSTANNSSSKLNLEQVVAIMPTENTSNSSGSNSSNSKEILANSMANTPRKKSKLIIQHHRSPSQQTLITATCTGINGLNGVLKPSDITNQPNAQLQQQQQQQQQTQPSNHQQVQQNGSGGSNGAGAPYNQKKRKTQIIKLPEKFEPQLDDLKKGTAELVDLTGADMGDTVLIQVCELIKLNSTLKTLKLLKNKISDEGLCTLLQAVNQNSSIQTLNLAQNQLSDKAVDMILENVKGHPTLKYIILSQNKINQRNVKVKVQELKKIGITISNQLK